MAATEHLNGTGGKVVERTSKEIRQDVALRAENISRTVEKIGERFTEKLDWREYVKDSPYWALGTAVGLGYLASGMLPGRSASMERNTRSMGKAGRDSFDGARAEAKGPNLLRVTLFGIAAKAANDWIKDVISTPMTSSCTAPRRQTGCGSICSPGADV